MKLSRTKLKRMRANQPKVKMQQLIVSKDGTSRVIKHYVNRKDMDDARVYNENVRIWTEKLANAKYVVNRAGVAIRDERVKTAKEVVIAKPSKPWFTPYKPKKNGTK